MNTSALTWTGWHRPRPGVRWRLICQAATEAEALYGLLTLALSGDVCVQPAGRDPNQPAESVATVSLENPRR